MFPRVNSFYMANIINNIKYLPGFWIDSGSKTTWNSSFSSTDSSDSLTLDDDSFSDSSFEEKFNASTPASRGCLAIGVVGRDESIK